MAALADELLREILAPSFVVPEHMFASNTRISPFCKVPKSISDMLLVCKRWMRVTTPFLYETVVIRTKAQASALNMALTRNPEFGLFVRKLRLEAAFGEYITSDIMRTMPRVRQFCFSPDVYHYEDISGLQTAFEEFDLERVVLTLDKGLNNQLRRRLVRNLGAALATWNNLVSPYHNL